MLEQIARRINETSGNREATMAALRLARPALLVLLLTSVHHVYGGYIYQTPERYHVLFIAAPAALVILGSLALLRSRAASVARWTFVLTTLVVAVLLFGGFEGAYNHVAKNVLYFAGTSEEQMRRLFPSDLYELPNDLFFELTGVLQAFAGAVTAWRLPRFIRTPTFR
jgi:cytochrome bd-type quinol oxidase subunit 2